MIYWKNKKTWKQIKKITYLLASSIFVFYPLFPSPTYLLQFFFIHFSDWVSEHSSSLTLSIYSNPKALSPMTWDPLALPADPETPNEKIKKAVAVYQKTNERCATQSVENVSANKSLKLSNDLIPSHRLSVRLDDWKVTSRVNQDWMIFSSNLKNRSFFSRRDWNYRRGENWPSTLTTTSLLNSSVTGSGETVMKVLFQEFWWK